MTVYGPYPGVVEKVHDGDTVYIKLDLGFDITVYARCRVYGINSPELVTDAGKTARDYAQQTLPVGTAVTVLSHGWDKYGGRIDADILMPSGNSFGDLMVDAGHAVRI